MYENRPTYDDEIDLVEFLKTLWDGKWFIVAFVAVALSIRGVFMLQKDAVYESKLIFSVDTIPPFYNKKKVLTDFQNKFYSVSIFEEWKKNNANRSVLFDDFSATKELDGIVFSRDKVEQLATLVFHGDSSFILVKSNQPTVLNDFFQYAIHINGLLKNKYVVSAKEELKFIGERFKDLSSADSDIGNIVLSIDRYIATAEKGANVFAIHHPTVPVKVPVSAIFALPVSIVLGAITGVFFILIRNVITKRKEQLAKV